MQLSVVVPIHNEEPSILPLYDRLTAVLERLRKPYEIIFVDDASTDRSFDLLANLVETDPRLKVIRLRRNFGQTAALAAGFDEAQGNVIISLDGDLQHAPEDIPALLEKIEEGYDIASGWRKNRLDNAVTRKIPSRIANWLMAKVSHVDLRDFGTTFKAYRAEILKDVNLYGELHRFIPALAAFYGARVAEVPIRNLPRASGGSHYGLGRTFRVMFDIFTIWFLLKYFTRPMHFFGKWGLVSAGAGGAILAFVGVGKALDGSRHHPGARPADGAGRARAGHGRDAVLHRPAGRSAHADVFRKPGPADLRGPRDPHAPRAAGGGRRARRSLNGAGDPL